MTVCTAAEKLFAEYDERTHVADIASSSTKKTCDMYPSGEVKPVESCSNASSLGKSELVEAGIKLKSNRSS